MIRLATGSDGTKYWRPIYIGFIKNDYVRRTLCMFAAPFVFLMAACSNIVMLLIHIVISFCTGLFRSIWHPLRSLKEHKEIWKKPRHKNSEVFNQHEYNRRELRLKLPEQEDCIKAVAEAHKRLEDLGWQNPFNAPQDGTPFQAYVSGYVEVCGYVTYEGTFPHGKFIHHADGECGEYHQSHEIKPMFIRDMPDISVIDPMVDSVVAYAMQKQDKLDRE